MKVTFCGHGKEEYGEAISKRLYEIIEELIKSGADEFLLGGYGNFDMLAAHTVKDLQQVYPHVKSTLVVPYINRSYDKELYDGSVYPPIENVPKKYAIVKRNEWSVNQADVVVAYIKYDWGGASKTYEYARKKKKSVVNLYKEQLSK